MTVALFAVGAVYDILGRGAARRVLPVMIAVGTIFYAVTVVFPDKFLVFVIFEMLVMLFALGVYCTLAIRGRLEGAGLMTAGILITIVAAAVQATGTLRFTLIWQFDYNGIFHLVQMPGVVMLAAGLRAAMGTKESPRSSGEDLSEGGSE